jgi:hypothetical protein
MSRLSNDATNAVLAPETDRVFLHLITIETSGGAILRFVDNTQDIISRGNTYTAAGFTIILPEQSSEGPGPCKLAIDNTDLSIFQTIKQAAGQTVTVSICIIMAQSPDVYERGPLKYKLRNVRASKSVIEGEVYDFYLADRKFPRDTYSPDDFEGMFF